MDRVPLDDHIEFDASSDLESLMSRVPARWVVYLFADEHDRAIQLLCVKNLRASLRRRLGSDSAEAEPSRKIDYRQLVRRVYWRRVDSEFEADLLYLDLARQLFPQSYEKLVAARLPWFVQVEPDADFPRYSKTNHPLPSAAEVFGPLADKADAQRLVEHLEDWFDLCRYHNILQQSPNGKACAYKEMGRCPAPCDGSVSMEQYRRLVRLSVSALGDPGDYIRAQSNRMKQAAAGLKFESAAKIKQYIDSLAQMGTGPFRFLRRLDDLRFVSLQRGPGARTAKVFFVSPAAVKPIACLLGPPESGAGVVQLALNEPRAFAPYDQLAAETFAVVTRHLFSEKPAGAFIPLDQLNDRSLAKAYRDVLKQRISDETDDEGVVRELQPAAG